MIRMSFRSRADSRWRQFAAATGGTLAVELAMAVPVIFALMMGGVEVTRYVLLNQKVERTSATLADLVSQSDALSEAALTNLIGAAGHVMTPYAVDTDGHIVISSMVNPAGTGAVISWQRGHGAGPGTGSGASRFGVEGGAAQLPAGFVVRQGENVIAVEVSFGYEPMLATAILDAHEVYNFALFRPRFSSLANLLP